MHYYVIDPPHKSHNALDKYFSMHHFLAKMCTFLLQIGALWDRGLVECRICELGQLTKSQRWFSFTGANFNATFSLLIKYKFFTAIPYNFHSRLHQLEQFALPNTCENWLSLVNSCVYYACQTCEIYQVLPYSVNFKAPTELWNSLSKIVLSKCSFICNEEHVNF